MHGEARDDGMCHNCYFHRQPPASLADEWADRSRGADDRSRGADDRSRGADDRPRDADTRADAPRYGCAGHIRAHCKRAAAPRAMAARSPSRYTDRADRPRVVERADTRADARSRARSRSPRPAAVLAPRTQASQPSASSSVDNYADLLAEARSFINLGRRQGMALQAAADRLGEVVAKIDRDRHGN